MMIIERFTNIAHLLYEKYLKYDAELQPANNHLPSQKIRIVMTLPNYLQNGKFNTEINKLKIIIKQKHQNSNQIKRFIIRLKLE